MAALRSGSQRERRTLLQFLSDHFYDVEALRQYLLQRKMSKVHQENRSLTHIREKYGPYIAGAFFVLKQGGAVKYERRDKHSIFVGIVMGSIKAFAVRLSARADVYRKFQDHEWIRSDKRGHLFLESLKLHTVPVQAVDASGCAINYDGLDNLLPLKELQSLSLQRCPHVDDWCLSRLYLLACSLQELSLSGCPHITERGLACLHHLQNLRRLDISNLPAVSYPGLTRILVEEMLPNCEVLGMDEDQGLQLGPEEQPQDSASPNPA